MATADQMKAIFREADREGTGAISLSNLKALFGSLASPLSPDQIEQLCRSWMSAGLSGVDDPHINYMELVDFLYSEPKPATQQRQLQQLQQELQAAKQEVSDMRTVIKRHAFEFTVGQYNILAGYMGNNMEPWFLYGVDMPEERRKSVFKLHGEFGPDGKPVNAGWPNYVRGVLSDEEIAAVERVDREHFAWEQRKDRLVQVIQGMDSDLLSLVECDHFDDHFKPALEAMGYEMIWKKRPRPNSADGCCIAWRKGLFELLSQHSVEYVDKYCPRTQRTWKDRIALLAILRVRLTGSRVCFVSTHLQRNPEDPTQDFLRARQVGQVLRALGEFTKREGAEDAAVILTGDLNCTSFGRLRGIANTVSLLSHDTYLHPFTFDAADVPTGVTSVTTARCMRIDAIMYQSQKLELMDVGEIPELTSEQPIPSAAHPSDHVPIVGQFRFRSRLHTTRQLAKDWFLCLAGDRGLRPLSLAQLREAFKLYESDGDGQVTASEVRKVLLDLFDVLPEKAAQVLAGLPAEGLVFATFVAGYLTAVKSGGMPCLDDFRDAFVAFDVDGGGDLDLDELLGAFRLCAPGAVPEEELTRLFGVIDTNGDGKVSVDEMTTYLAKAWVESFELPGWGLRPGGRRAEE